MNRTRNNQFALRLSDCELALFNRKQLSSGLSKTDFLVQMLKTTNIKVFYFSEALKILHHELRKIGVNLNQVAYLSNIDHGYEARDMLSRMSEDYFAVIDRLINFLDHPLINAYIVDDNTPLPNLNPLEEQCRSEM